MPWTTAIPLIAAGVGAVGSIYSAKKSASAIEKASMRAAETQGNAALTAAQLQAQSAADAMALQEMMFNLTREDQAPWREAGEWALGEIQDGIQSGRFLPEEFNFVFSETDPSYQWRFDQGQKALANSAAARGGSLGGRAIKEAQQYGQGMASTEYQNEFDRYVTGWNSDFNRGVLDWKTLAGLSGSGQDAAQFISNAGQQYGANAGNLMIGSANALGQGMIGNANAFASAYGDIGNAQAGLYGAYGNAFNDFLGGAARYGTGQGWWGQPAYNPDQYEGGDNGLGSN